MSVSGEFRRVRNASTKGSQILNSDPPLSAAERFCGRDQIVVGALAAFLKDSQTVGVLLHVDDLLEGSEHRLLGTYEGNPAVREDQLSGIDSGQGSPLDRLAVERPDAIANACVADRDAYALAATNEGRSSVVLGEMGSQDHIGLLAWLENHRARHRSG
jgi:hypothetical protein